ncbi:MAG: hypothetical protein ACYCSW_02635 [bacterium]
MNSKSFIRYRINTLSPIIISDRSGDANMINSKSYISGNNVLGIFANKYIYINKNKSSENKENINNINNKEFHNDDLFYNWFLNEKLLFTNGYISDEEETYFAPPISIKSDKYNEYNIFDLFYDEYEASSEALEKIDNFVSINNDLIKKNYVKKSLSFHHARDKKTGTAKKGDIFNYESISENQIFKGSIIGGEEHLKNFVNMFGTKFIAYIGKSKNSQYGKIEIELEYPLLIEKQNYCPEIKTAEICSDDDSVVLTLLSDTIIYNENGFSAVNIYDFEKYLNKRLKDLLLDNNNNNNKVNNVSGYQDLKLTKAFIQKGKSEEFVGIWKLKNQSENVFSAGSCFLLEGLSLKYNHHEMLKKICIEGIGEKTYEGFGRAVCGWQNKIENYSMASMAKDAAEDEQIENKKPEYERPDFVTNLIKNIIKDNLMNVIIGEAMEDANSFKNTPSKSLMGKLQLLARNDIIGFREKLDIIVGDKNKPAKMQLENSDSNNNNMLDFIRDLNNSSSDKFNINRIKNKNSGLFENLDEFINDMKNDSNLINNLKRVYFSTFFNFIRKNK